MNTITKFLLKDNYDSQFTDLITFDKPVNKEDVIKAIEKVKNEYTNEDIYNGLDTLGVPYTLLWLGQLDEFEY